MVRTIPIGVKSSLASNFFKTSDPVRPAAPLTITFVFVDMAVEEQNSTEEAQNTTIRDRNVMISRDSVVNLIANAVFAASEESTDFSRNVASAQVADICWCLHKVAIAFCILHFSVMTGNY